jgi:hypothetical protein
MVKHHIKSKKKNKASKKQILEEQKKKKEQQLNNLDRFAGSSEEEDSDVEPDEEMEEPMKGSDGDDDTDDDTDDDDEYDGDKEETVRNDRSSKTKNNNIDDDSSSPSSDEDEYNGGESNQKQSRIDDDDDDEDDDGNEWMTNSNRNKGQMKMAFAMSKILGLATSSDPKGSTTLMDKMKSKTPILSKTTTPLQKLLKKEEEEIQAMKLKRKQRRITNLTALHKPLSAATSTFRAKNNKNGGSGGASSLATEIEIESAHRRVATRGVVALFNTIAKHQQQSQQLRDGNAFKTESSSGKPMKNMTKFGFLDMLKQTAPAQAGSTTGSNGKDGKKNGSKESPSSEKKSKSPGWNALKDDFMMNSKLKDWDKELSDDDDDSDMDGDVKGYSGTKRRQGNKDLDDIMDDDDSSGDDEIKSSKASKRRKKVS